MAMLNYISGAGAAVLIAGLSVSAFASERALNASIAPSLLKARTQISILKTDDKADVGCQSRAFKDARVLYNPWREGIDETKWQEHWVLDRCGEEITYRVFFTTVGRRRRLFLL